MGSVKFTTAVFTGVATNVNLMVRQQGTIDMCFCNNGSLQVQVYKYRRQAMASQIYNIASRDGVNPDWLSGFRTSMDNVLALDDVGIAMVDEWYARDLLESMAVMLFDNCYFRDGEWVFWSGAEIASSTIGQLYERMVTCLLELCHFGTREFYDSRGDNLLQVIVPSALKDDLLPEYDGCSPEWLLMTIQKLVSPELRFNDVDLMDAAVHQDFGNESIDGLANQKWSACQMGFRVSFSIFFCVHNIIYNMFLFFLTLYTELFKICCSFVYIYRYISFYFCFLKKKKKNE